MNVKMTCENASKKSETWNYFGHIQKANEVLFCGTLAIGLWPWLYILLFST